MPQPEWESLEREVRDLAARVARLEAAASPALPGPVKPLPGRAPETPRREEAEAPVTALVPLLGRALLGLAGAYLLRAVTESATLPPNAGVAAGLVYAIGWLVWAARTPAERRLPTALYSLTSVLVLAPLLWEATLRFHAVSTWTAGAILLLFTVFGLAVSWKKDLLVVATIATLAGLGTAAGLLMATHDVLPFTLVFLAIAAAVETSACLNHWLSERWLAATAADLSVLLATWLVTNERGLPPSYAPIPHAWLLAAQAVLLAIYLSSTIIRTLLRHFTFTGFETAQCGLAFFIGVGGGLRVSGEAPAIGCLALACAAACYLVSFARLERHGSNSRNFYTYSTFGLLLALAGSRIALSGSAVSAAWSALAIACVWAGVFSGRLTLQVHGGVYLLLALASSGALRQAAAFLLGGENWPGVPKAALVFGLLSAILCYVPAAWYAHGERGSWLAQAFRLGSAGALVWLLAGFTGGAFTAAYHGVLGAGASHAYCATLRTGVLACGALLLAWAGSHWERLELSRLIYPLMVLGAWRLLANDLREDRKAALFLSLLVYGAALLVLPRLSRMGRAQAAQPSEKPAPVHLADGSTPC